ncbi:hypothetical protein QBC41DRAFT_48603 [Cercophora samala]|uniref:Uncharacterized protein n=1 Tax=Cercophora samala TaxID=330535 RepID=A0AA39ZIG1_9PEZI|nr:hypothetical protein QBC41DRAFT_48603 [Cercophora samala]
MYWSVDPLSCKELARLRHAFLVVSIACCLDRRIRGYCPTVTERQNFLQYATADLFGRFPLPQLHQQQYICAVYDYMSLTWDAVLRVTIPETDAELGIKTCTCHDKKPDVCGTCSGLELYPNGPLAYPGRLWCCYQAYRVGLRRTLCGLGPEGLWRGLQTPVRDDSVTGQHCEYRSIPTLCHFSFKSALRFQDLTPLLRRLPLPLAHASQCTTTEEAGVGNLAWKVVAEERQRPMALDFRYEDTSRYPKRGVICSETWGCSMWGWGDEWNRVEFGDLALRGWTVRDDERIKRMGWDKVDVLGWIAQGEEAWSTESERLEAMKLGRCFIKRVKYTRPPLDPPAPILSAPILSVTAGHPGLARGHYYWALDLCIKK